MEGKELDGLVVAIKKGSVWIDNSVKEGVAIEGLSGYYKRIEEQRHVGIVASRYMENNNVDNHTSFKVNTRNVLEV